MMPTYSRTFAQLVFDGAEDFFIPKPMGTPSGDQLQGNARENTLELCGRVCYDSLGSGRNSRDYHDNLIKSRHLSVYEHTPVTVQIDLKKAGIDYQDLACLFNRPGITVLYQSESIIRVTFNYRAAMEWIQNTTNPTMVDEEIRQAIHYGFLQTAPMVYDIAKKYYPIDDVDGTVVEYTQVVEAKYPAEQHISIYMSGSRGFSHEQVRHRFNISQRSTRYVDESESAWVKHPLILQYVREIEGEGLHKLMDKTVEQAQETYRTLVDLLEDWLVRKGHAKTPARKQARGAARGFLGNALQTELIFTASVRAWRDIMLVQRASHFADAEIREVYAGAPDNAECVIQALKQSRYADHFKDVNVVVSPDGIGNTME